jgi:hypothetical protein
MYNWSTDISKLVLLKIDVVLLVRLEISTAVTMKNVVFWDVTPCGSWRNRKE